MALLPRFGRTSPPRPPAPPEPPPVAPGLPLAFLDTLDDPVLVFDAGGVLQAANVAALRTLGCEPGRALPDLRAALGAAVSARLQAALDGTPLSAPARADGVRLSPLDGGRWCLRLASRADPAPVPAPPAPVLADATLQELHQLFWNSPQAAMLLDAGLVLLDVNPAFARLAGRPRESLPGQHLADLLHGEDRDALRQAGTRHGAFDALASLPELRLVDGAGRMRWLRPVHHRARPAGGDPVLLSFLQDHTGEHVAREQAERATRDFDLWFDLSPQGMLLFDAAGLVVRSNVAFEAIAGEAPVELRDASPALRALLQWDPDLGMTAPLEPDAPPLASDGALPQRDGSLRSVRALLRGYEMRRGQRRYMAVLEDRTAQEERELAELQLDALADTAGAGLATFGSGLSAFAEDRHGTAAAARPADPVGRAAAPSTRPPAAPDGPAGEAAPDLPVPADADTGRPAESGFAGLMDDTRPTGGAPTRLASIRRELVQPGSLPEFERLQRALRRGERCEVRYAIDHPELGPRWLVTRVEPGKLASGRRTTSVVTLDVTDQQLAQMRHEQLLGELSTILESSPAGIAYLHGGRVARCNRRFEAMLRLAPGQGAGRELRGLLEGHVPPGAHAHDLGLILQQARQFDTEIEVAGDGGHHWYALSLRRVGEEADGAPTAIVVLSEVTRLKAQQAEVEALARDREQMARALTRQAERTRAILDSVLVGIVTVGENGIVWMNRSARRMFGGDLADFVGLPIATVAGEDPAHPFRRTDLREALADGQAVTFECQVQARDGRGFWVVGNAVSTLGEGGRRELTWALLDIEQRRQAEARIAEAQASLQRIINLAPLAITLRDAATLRVQQINPVAAAMRGHAPDDAVGLTPEQQFGPEFGARLSADLRAALATPEQVTAREYVLPGAGEGARARTWDARFLPLSPPGEAPDHLLMVATDVTEQRAAQRAELQAAIAQREMLVQEVHHRIKNNLQGVAGLMQQIAAKRPEVKGVIAEVVGQVQAIAQVYGLQVGNVGPLRVRNVVEAIAQSVQRTFGHAITFTATGDGADWSLPEAESIPIALTLNELLTNAIKHVQGDSPVRCTLHADAQGVQVEIANRGALPADFRIDHRPATVSGLGLVRALLPRRAAALEMRNEGPDVVARVSLRPPVVAALSPA